MNGLPTGNLPVGRFFWISRLGFPHLAHLVNARGSAVLVSVLLAD